MKIKNLIASLVIVGLTSSAFATVCIDKTPPAPCGKRMATPSVTEKRWTAPAPAEKRWSQVTEKRWSAPNNQVTERLGAQSQVSL